MGESRYSFTIFISALDAVVSFMPRPFYPQGKEPSVLIEQETV
jgi:hypothetical protein